MKADWRFICALAAAVVLGIPASASGAAGDIVVGNYSSGEVTRLAPDGSSSEVIATGAPLDGPYGLDFGPDALYVANSSSEPGVYRILPGSTIAQVAAIGMPVQQPARHRVRPHGAAYVAEDALGIVRADVGAMTATTYRSDPDFDVAYALAIAPDRTVFVSDVDEVLRIDPVSKDVTTAATIPDSPLAGSPSVTGIERAPSGLLYAYDDGEARVISINPGSGAVDTVASGGNLDAGSVYNIAIEPKGTLVMGNTSSDRIVRVNLQTGAQSLIPGTFTNTEGIAVEPPRCRGKLATIVGSTKADVLRGSTFPDVIASLGGNDR